MDKGAKAEIRSRKGVLRALIQEPELSIGLFIVLLFVSLSLFTENFFNANNLVNLLKQSSVNGILAIAMALALISGGIDLSVGAMLGLSIGIGGRFIDMGCSWAIVFGVILGVATLCGLINGLLIVKLHVAPIIITLGTMNIYRGIAYIYTIQNYNIPDEYGVLGTGFAPILFWLVLVVLVQIMLRKLPLGRNLYAVGGNESCALLAGLKVDKIKTVTYMLSGVIVGLGAIVYLGRTDAVLSSAGMDYETDAIAAAVLGGLSLTGGKGRVIGTALGALLLALLMNAMTMLHIHANWQGLVKGAVMILALILDGFRNAYFSRR